MGHWVDGLGSGDTMLDEVDAVRTLQLETPGRDISLNSLQTHTSCASSLHQRDPRRDW